MTPEQKAEKEYPETYEVDGFKYDDNCHVAKRLAYIKGMSVAEKELEAKDKEMLHWKNMVKDLCEKIDGNEKEIERLKGLIQKQFFGTGHSLIVDKDKWNEFSKENNL